MAYGNWDDVETGFAQMLAYHPDGRYTDTIRKMLALVKVVRQSKTLVRAVPMSSLLTLVLGHAERRNALDIFWDEEVGKYRVWIPERGTHYPIREELAEFPEVVVVAEQFWIDILGNSE